MEQTQSGIFVWLFSKLTRMVGHQLHILLLAQYVIWRTRGAMAPHSRSIEMPRSRTGQFSRSFALSCVRLWNELHEFLFAGEVLCAFKTSDNHFPSQD